MEAPLHQPLECRCALTRPKPESLELEKTGVVNAEILAVSVRET